MSQYCLGINNSKYCHSSEKVILIYLIHNGIFRKGHPFSAYANVSEKLTFLTSGCTLTCAYQRVRNAGFSEHFAYVLNG